MTPEELAQIRGRLMSGSERMDISIGPSDYLSTGSTLLDLACSRNRKGGLVKGKLFLFVGDSSSGKTFFCLTCFAEAMRNPAFKDYRIIYDGGEGGALMDFQKFFGSAVADAVEPPAGTKSDPEFSITVDDLYFNLHDNLDKGRPFIYVQDSMDVLSSKEEQEKQKKLRAARKQKKLAEQTGTMTDGKAKKNSSGMRQIIPRLEKSGSILIVINQTRDNVGDMFNPSVYSGGRAQKFYSCLEMWTSVRGSLKKTVNGTERKIGIQVEVKVKKNRLTGNERSVLIPLYTTYGIDNLGSMVDFLVKEGKWSKAEGGAKITVTDPFSFEGTRDKLIEYIEQNELEPDVTEVVCEVWEEIEEALTLRRKPRYE